jgi:hypothetical protein
MHSGVTGQGPASMAGFPAAITKVNHIEPVPRRIRAVLADEVVFDTTRAWYVWEWPYYPQYYIPLADVRSEVLTSEGRDAITGTAGQGPSRHQMNWERHHIEVVHTATSGNARRATDLLREHLASVGCDPLAVRIVAQLQHPGGPDDDFEDLVRRLPGCHGTPSATHLACR